MNETENIIAALNELGYTFNQLQVDEDAVRFDITVDPGEELGVVGLLYRINGEWGFRLMAHIDELDKEQPLAQLKNVMSLNGDIPLGAYCLDPEEDLLYVTVNVPFEDISADNLAFLVEALLAAQEFYYLEFYGDDDGEMPEG